MVESEHETCFFKGFYCCKFLKIIIFFVLLSELFFFLITVKAKGDFKCTNTNGNSDTYCIETVNYQCPPFMGSFCRREVEFQRKAIMNNLTLQFPRKNYI